MASYANLIGLFKRIQPGLRRIGRNSADKTISTASRGGNA
jgi:hypothetical protein